MEAPQSIEASGTTIDDAIARGLEALNVTRSEVDVLILTAEPGPAARVRLTRKPPEAAPASSPPKAQPITPEESATTTRLLQAVLDRMKFKAQIVERDPSTHNHEGPDTMGLWGKGRFSSGVDPQYLDRVLRTIAETAAEALSRLKPARLVLGRTRTPGLIEDGRLPEVIDDTLVSLQVTGEDGSTLGTVVNWSSHPEALGAKNTLVTSDFPHFLGARVEERLGGTCVFLVGSIGGLMTPLGVKLSDADGKAIPADRFALARAVGERAAEAALGALASGRPSASSTLEEDLVAAVPLVRPWLTPDMTAGYGRIFAADCPHHYNF